MKKTFTVTLNGIIFHIEEDAYEVLKNYLNAIKEHFRDQDDSGEVVADIEASIAEKFSDKISTKKQVITKVEVDELIKVMGSIEDITEEELVTGGPEVSDSSQKKDEQSREKKEKRDHKVGKKLFRNTDDMVIAGVCSGLASFFGIDPVIVRLIFGLSILFGGAGVIAYIVLWVVMAPAKTSAQKLEMQGDQVTLEKLEAIAKDKSEKLRNMDTSGVRNALAAPFRLIGELFKGLGRIIRGFGGVILAIIGICIIVATVIAMTGVGMTAATLIFNINSPYLTWDIPLQEFFTGPVYFLGVASAFFVVIIPLIFILLLGATLASRKNAFKAVTNSILIGVWMIAIIILGVSAIDLAPKIRSRVAEYEDQEKISRDYNFENFSRVSAAGNAVLNITPAEDFSITGRGLERDIERLEMRVSNGTLKIKNKEDWNFCFICHFKPVEIDITMPELVEFTGSGGVKSTISGYSPEEFSMELSGASRSDLDVSANILDFNLSGASRLEFTGSSSSINGKLSGASKTTLNGQSDSLKTGLSGASKLYAFNLLTGDAELDLSGASQAEVNASSTLNVEASGASKIYYKGDPEIISDISSSSDLEKTSRAMLKNTDSVSIRVNAPFAMEEFLNIGIEEVVLRIE